MSEIVVVSGYFDPLHVEHIELFKLARKLGDKLIVILNNDGTLYGSFRETVLNRAKLNITSLLFDSNNIITAALEISQDGTD